MRTNASAKIEPPNEKPPLYWGNILAPTDFSKTLKQALKTSTCLAEQCGAKINLLHVVWLPASCSITAPLDVEGIMNSSRESLDEISEEIPAALLQEKLVRLGAQETVQEIIETARDLSADLIVIATHGHSRFERAWLQSTAEKVIRHAPCPVLLVRGKEVFSDPNKRRRD
jgi:nucleotide-binding universal stress UspA family protein